MIRAPKSISEAQIKKYWREWGPARRALRANHYTPAECEDFRKEVLRRLGVESHTELDNRKLDEVLKVYAALADPRNGKRQAELADQPLKRVRARIAEAARELGYTDAQVEGVSQQMWKRPIAQLTEVQLVKVSQALNTHVARTTASQQPA